MRSPIGWYWPALALLAVVVSAAAWPRVLVTLPAAAIGVWAAAMSLTTVVAAAPRSSDDAAPRWSTAPPVGVREMFQAGPLGREDLTLRLDWLEHRAKGGRGPVKPSLTFETVFRATPEEFREYLAARIATIEGFS